MRPTIGTAVLILLLAAGSAPALDDPHGSTDGISWDGPYERPETLGTGYLPPYVAVGNDVIFGIGGGHFDVLIARLQE